MTLNSNGSKALITTAKHRPRSASGAKGVGRCPLCGRFAGKSGEKSYCLTRDKWVVLKRPASVVIKTPQRMSRPSAGATYAGGDGSP